MYIDVVIATVQKAGVSVVAGFCFSPVLRHPIQLINWSLSSKK